MTYAVGPSADGLGAADQFRRAAHDAGVRVAHPWRDSELIDFVLRLPPEHAFDPNLDRPVAREAMRGLVPEVVRTSDAKPFFNGLLAEALHGPDRELVGELTRAPELGAYVLQAPLGNALARGEGPAAPLDAWRVATAGAWLRAQSDPAALERLLDRAVEPIVDFRRVDTQNP
jgi:hypothetical protein